MNDLISERDFADHWQPLLSPADDLFQFTDVRDKPIHQIWTIVDSGNDADGNWYACPGFHIVNKLGYVMTKKAWSNGTPDAVYFLNDID